MKKASTTRKTTKKKATSKAKDKLCVGCNEPIHPKRLEILPHTVVCVKCSNTPTKKGMTVTLGTGEDTFNETIIMDDRDFRILNDLELATNDLLMGSDEEDEDEDTEVEPPTDES